MESPPEADAIREDTLFETPLPSTDDQPMSPTAASEAYDVDSLVTDTAKRIAHAINDLKRELDERDSSWVTANGTFELVLKTEPPHSYKLSIVQSEHGEEHPVTVQARRMRANPAASGSRESNPPLVTALSSATAYRPTRRDSDTALEQDLVSRKKRKLDEGEEVAAKRTRLDEEEDEEDIMPLVSKDDLRDIMSKLREDIQEDTSESVNHVQKLLRRFKEEWHEKAKWDDEQASTRQSRGPFGDSVVGNGAIPSGTFPSRGADRDDANTALPDIVRREAKLLSSQIRWVEECRRVAADIHVKKEDNWRTSSAGFHDRARQDREMFQTRMLNEMIMQGQKMNHILNEVKTIGLYTQSMKWETPDHLTQGPYQPRPTAPAFPTQSPSSPAGRGRGALPNKR